MRTSRRVSPVWQKGGVNQRSSIDNVMLTLAVIEKSRYLGRSTYVMFTDAEKCFDKLWLNDGIFELWRCGTDIRDCMMIRKLNARAEIKVRTSVGSTDPFIVEEIARQGTVYGPQICIASTDKVNIMGRKVETYYGPDLPIEAGVFVDDVSGVGGYTTANNVIYNCRLLEEKKKFTFNNKGGKTEYVVIPVKNDKEIKTITEKVKNGKINRVPEHKMLGTWIAESGKYETDINKKKTKLQYMINTVRQRTLPQKLGKYAVDAKLKLAETIIIAGLLHNAEGFPSFTETEIKELEKVQHLIITELLGVPNSTSYLALLLETGFWTMKARLTYKKLMLYQNILKSDSRRTLKSLVKVQKEENRRSTWYGGIAEIISEYELTEWDPAIILKSKWKTLVKKKITEKTEIYIKQKLSTMTKGRTICQDKYEKKGYLGEVDTNTSRKITMMRLHMSRLPGNYRGKGEGICHLCNAEKGQIEHYFVCSKVQQLVHVWKVEKDDIGRSEDVKSLVKASKFIDKVEQLMEPTMEIILNNNNNNNKGNNNTVTVKVKDKMK